MEKTLFAVDELSGFVLACAYVRPAGDPRPDAQVGQEEAQAAELRRRRQPRGGPRGRRAARPRLRRAHQRRDRRARGARRRAGHRGRSDAKLRPRAPEPRDAPSSATGAVLRAPHVAGPARTRPPRARRVGHQRPGDRARRARCERTRTPPPARWRGVRRRHRRCSRRSPAGSWTATARARSCCRMACAHAAALVALARPGAGRRADDRDGARRARRRLRDAADRQRDADAVAGPRRRRAADDGVRARLGDRRVRRSWSGRCSSPLAAAAGEPGAALLISAVVVLAGVAAFTSSAPPCAVVPKPTSLRRAATGRLGALRSRGVLTIVLSVDPRRVLPRRGRGRVPGVRRGAWRQGARGPADRPVVAGQRHRRLSPTAPTGTALGAVRAFELGRDRAALVTLPLACRVLVRRDGPAGAAGRHRRSPRCSPPRTS